MDYNLLICASSKQWVAIDIDPDGNNDRISFDGNDMAEVDSLETVTHFCAHILNYYNIEAFSDIGLNIKIVEVADHTDLMNELFFQMKEAKSVNVIDAKSVIPIFVLKKCIVKPGGMIDVKCMEENYSLRVDDDLFMSFTSDKSGEEITIEPEWFSILFRFDCSNLISNEPEWKAVEEKYHQDIESKEREIAEQKILYSLLKKNFDELESIIIQLKTELEARRSRFDDKRTIIRFDRKNIKSLDSGSSYSTSRVIFSLLLGSELLGFTITKLLKGEGDVVKKGDRLIEVFTNSNNKRGYIKADIGGRCFFLVKDNDRINDNAPFAIISDPADTRDEVLKWYEKMVEKKVDNEASADTNDEETTENMKGEL